MSVEFAGVSKTRPHRKSLVEEIESLFIALCLKKNKGEPRIGVLELRLYTEEIFENFNCFVPVACCM